MTSRRRYLSTPMQRCTMIEMTRATPGSPRHFDHSPTCTNQTLTPEQQAKSFLITSHQEIKTKLAIASFRSFSLES